jgi:3-oxoacyl-[acyl-carrier-protein] synthase-3
MSAQHTNIQQQRRGVVIAGTGMALPGKSLTNHDLEKVMDTSDEWIIQRTGIHTRRIIDTQQGESTWTLSTRALKSACEDARLDPAALDMVILATMTPEMHSPASACRVAAAVGAKNAGAWDLNAACSGFVYGLNVAHALISTGAYRNIGLIGADSLSTLMDYSNNGRGTAIIFGDGAGAAVLRSTDDLSKGILAQTMYSDGQGWKDIYVPMRDRDFPPGTPPDPSKCGYVQMNGATVFKFAVGTFPGVIAETLEKAGVKAGDVDMYVCHQSNARILQAARERFGLPEEKLYMNIERYGNTVGASVPLCLHELRAAGRIQPGMRVMFVAFGAGLTWGSSLWQL